mgnify:CR=1 FL=1
MQNSHSQETNSSQQAGKETIFMNITFPFEIFVDGAFLHAGHSPLHCSAERTQDGSAKNGF